MSETDNRDPRDLPPPIAAGAEAPQDVDEGDDEGDEGPDEGEGSAHAPGQSAGGPPGQGGGRRRRRRRRRRGAQVHFTPDGQAYRLVPGPDGQQQQVFLTPQELQQHQQRMAQQQQQQQGGGHPGGQQQQPRAPQPAPQPSLAPVEGVLDTEAKGPNAFLRQLKRNLLPAPDDAEIPKNLVQKLRLRSGQYLNAYAQMKGSKGIIQRVEQADGRPLEQMSRLPHFADLTSVDPVERIKLENGHREMVTRVLDLISPIGKGQRALIVAPPKTGKTIMLQRIAQAVVANHPEIHLMVLLIDERPEEVTDMRRSIKAEVLASSSDRPTGDHLKVAELALERARRLVESGKDVMILLDSITRLARAYNKEVDNSGRTLSGGMDSRALERPKRIFGAARATEEAGSLTIVGTALIDTGSRMDEVIFEEFKGTGNSEVTLDRLLAEKRVFPAINIGQSGTRKEEKLFTHKEYEKVKKMRQMLFAVKPVEAMEALVKRLSRYTYNDEFLDEL
ncbi:transcription termination factor Rho [Vitiosangium sp. GDMCC 1.1324]|uniref:transcription termination factor Rho n=1 Tax=Vitiosangium sp. (strain GDMCC 1.1324) TaxID=2138576 RepID=UPI000D38999D|nr:transcription termination factor Rho [Vitiosangium sp. GDMCC 1.1324]PTL80456.1 transcription termination factor Rho [Vitiosangium sp. GDMCC 1.1324]